MDKVLIIDDDATMRTYVSEWLEHERFTVEEANSGTEAKRKLSAGNYDLIVLDWNLGDAQGIDICRWFRGRGGSTPILMLTGKNMIADKVNGFDAGADDYLTKPFELIELTARLHALLRRGSLTTPSQVVSQGWLSIDPLSHTAKVDGKELQLTPKEFDVLEFFVRHPGQVFSTDALYDRLWKSSTLAASPETVRVFINRLRDKLDEHGRGNSLKNVHSVGYKLVIE